MIDKDKPIRNQKYLNWVKTLPCCVSGMPADDPHHVIGVGRGKMGGKECDLLTMPVTRAIHQAIHSNPSDYDQWKYVALTLREAVKQGILRFDNEAMK